MESEAPFTATTTGVRLMVRLTPKGGRAGVIGVTRDADGRTALALKVAAPPVEGAANAALLTYLAKALGIRKSALCIASGETARLKRIEIDGDALALLERLRALVADLP